MGKYCLHFHQLSDCPDCEFYNNAIEHSHQRGIIVHGTSRSTVENNILWDVRGAGVYIEDGNEYMNQIKYNVVICPWSLAHPTYHGCTIPGTDNAESDTPLNQAGIYSETAANDFIGNRASNSFNGMVSHSMYCSCLSLLTNTHNALRSSSCKHQDRVKDRLMVEFAQHIWPLGDGRGTHFMAILASDCTLWGDRHRETPTKV